MKSLPSRGQPTRRLVLAGAAATAWHPSARSDPATGAPSFAEIGERELMLEAELEEYLVVAGAPQSALCPMQASAVGAMIKQLEMNLGRQQRAGWGQSDSAWDMPFIGAWDVIFASAPSQRAGATSTQARSIPVPVNPTLVSARQWIYGPGVGGFQTECVYAFSDGPSQGSLLISGTGNVRAMPSHSIPVVTRASLDPLDPTRSRSIFLDPARFSSIPLDLKGQDTRLKMTGCLAVRLCGRAAAWGWQAVHTSTGRSHPTSPSVTATPFGPT